MPSWLPLGVREQLSPLAQILVDKGYVDKVLAPNHKIDETEAVTVLRHFLEGGRTPQSLFKDWVSWAMDWLQTLKQEAEKA